MGEYLSTPVKDKSIEEGDNSYLRYASCAMQGWRIRMEDSHIACLSINMTSSGNPSSSSAIRANVFGVFDGHGGKEVAQWVKKKFTDELIKNKNFLNKNFSKSLSENFLTMDKLMQESQGRAELLEESKKSKGETKNNNGQENFLFKGLFGSRDSEDRDVAMSTGCTATVCLIDEEKAMAYFANAGDSRIIVGKNGVAFAMTVDHKPDSDQEKARIYKANGFVNDGRVKGVLNLSRSLGDLEYKQSKNLPAEEQMITANPDITSYDLRNADFIFIGCDGVYDCLSNQEIVDFIDSRLKKQGENARLGKILEEMLDMILPAEMGGDASVGFDNMSAVLVVLKKV